MSQAALYRTQRAVFEDRVSPLTFLVENGLIAEHYSPSDPLPDLPLTDLGDLAVLPGLIDLHVHFNEPGRTEWEGWESGTRAAVAGGLTTVVDMPLNCIPSTTDAASFHEKLASTGGKLWCDVAFWGGAVPDHLHRLDELWECGVLGFKAFLSDPGTAEFQNLDEGQLEDAMRRCAALGAVLLVHAEWPGALCAPPTEAQPQEYRSWLDSRPLQAEREAIDVLARLARKTGCRVHVVHLSSGSLADALDRSLMTSETCPHYLTFCAEEIEEGQTRFKCAPPIRESSHRESLWRTLHSGDIDLVASDHSPCPPGLKSPSFLDSWGGIAGVGYMLSTVWHGASQRGLGLEVLAEWLAAAPARIAGLEGLKGSLAVGRQADFVVFDPEGESDLLPRFHRHPGSPFEGRRWRGRIRATYLRGRCVFKEESHPHGPSGRFLPRPASSPGVDAGTSLERPHFEPGLERLNHLPPEEAEASFLAVCHSQRWVSAMMAARPFASTEELIESGHREWAKLGPQDCLEALAGHPRIGEKAKGDSLDSRWSRGEQAAAADGNQEAAEQLRTVQQKYEEKFGYLFLICATGKSKAEILEQVRLRLQASPEQEIHTVAEELGKIIKLRLEKLIRQ